MGEVLRDNYMLDDDCDLSGEIIEKGNSGIDPYVWRLIYDGQTLREFDKFSELMKAYEGMKKVMLPSDRHLLTWHLFFKEQ